MKKYLSFALACAFSIQLTGISAVSAEGVTDLYADIYEISFKTGEALTEDSEITLLCGADTVDVKVSADGQNVTITPETGYFKRDAVYKLTVDGKEKEFKIKTLFFEDFTGKEDGAASGTISNFYGNMDITTDITTEYGAAFYQSEKLALTDAVLSISDFEASENDRLTFSADVEGYGKKAYKADGESTYAANAGYIVAYMGMGNTEKNSLSGAYAMQLKQANFKAGTIDAKGEFTKEAEADKGYEKAVEEKVKFGFGKVTNDTVELTSYSYDTASNTRSMAIRKTADKLYAMADGVELMSFANGDADADRVCFMGDYRTVLVLDNISVTCCTEDVAEPEKGEVKAIGLDGDFSALYLEFDRTLKGVSDFSKITVYENGEETDADISLTGDDNEKLKIVPVDYSSGNTYTVSVDEGFGTKYMWTYSDYSFEKYIAPEYIKITDAVTDINGITLTFDRDISALAQTEKITVYKDGTECDKKISVSGEKITVKPADYVIGSTYKIVIPAGFGNKNIYLLNEYTFEKEYTKSEMKVEKLSGGSTELRITFSEDISEVGKQKIAEVTRDNAEILSTSAVSGKTLTLTLGEALECGVTYEVYVKTFETEVSAMKNAYRQRFKLEEVVFEDFEDDELADGVSAGGAIIADGNKSSGITEADADKNKRRIIWSGMLEISHPDVVSAEDYEITFDYQLYNANLNNNDKTYTSSPPFSQWYFNQGTDANSGYKMYVNAAGVRQQYYHEYNGAWTDVSTKSHTQWKHGDAWYDSNNKIYHIYDLGDTLPFEKNGRTVSERSLPAVQKIRIVKSGANIYGYRDSEQIIKFEPSGTVPIYTTGSVKFHTQVTETGVYDNLSVKVFKLVNDAELAADSLTVSGIAGGKVDGSFRVGNYSGGNIPLKIAVCAYGEDNLMQSMQILDVNEILAGEKPQFTFSLEKTENVKRVKLFLWDNLGNLKQYGNYDFALE